MKRYFVYAQHVHSADWIGAFVIARDIITAIRTYARVSQELSTFDYGFITAGQVE